MDPHSFSKLDPDPDPHSLKKLDLDPHKFNADPKHWRQTMTIGWEFRIVH
jgi:hypothetical protein